MALNITREIQKDKKTLILKHSIEFREVSFLLYDASEGKKRTIYLLVR